MVIFNLFSVCIKWAELDKHLQLSGKKVVPILMDGMCFLKAVQKCLQHDLHINYEIHDLKDRMFNEILEHLDFYSEFHHNCNKSRLVQDTMTYLNTNKFTIDVVDIVIMACVNAVKVNLIIYSQSREQALLIRNMGRISTNDNIYWKYDHHGGNIHGVITTVQ